MKPDYDLKNIINGFYDAMAEINTVSMIDKRLGITSKDYATAHAKFADTVKSTIEGLEEIAKERSNLEVALALANSELEEARRDIQEFSMVDDNRYEDALDILKDIVEVYSNRSGDLKKSIREAKSYLEWNTDNHSPLTNR